MACKMDFSQAGRCEWANGTGGDVWLCTCMGFASLPNGTASLPVEAKIWTPKEKLMCDFCAIEIGWKDADDAE
jgi:hypothetical protein